MTIMPIVSANQQENTHAHLSFLSRPSARMAPLLPSMLLCDMSSVCMQSFLSSTCIKNKESAHKSNPAPHIKRRRPLAAAAQHHVARQPPRPVTAQRTRLQLRSCSTKCPAPA